MTTRNETAPEEQSGAAVRKGREMFQPSSGPETGCDGVEYTPPAGGAQDGDLTEAEMAQIRRAEAATAEHLAGREGGLSESAIAMVARLMQQIDERRLADGTAVIENGEVTSRDLSEAEIDSGKFPLAALTRREVSHG